MRNIELKARLSSYATAESICEAINAEFAEDIQQTDTYFSCENGRLKLRECEPGDDYLVFYTRPDVAELKASDYEIQYVDAGVKDLLERAYGVLRVVEKVRGLWHWENVRIHLDRVKGLGTFIEFEAVLSEEFDDEDGFRKLSFLQETFGIEDGDLLDVSYAGLVSDSAGD